MTTHPRSTNTQTYQFCSRDYERGQIVALRNLDRNAPPGTWAVITDVGPAQWTGEDRDVYSHIQYWYTARPATQAETEVGMRYAAAAREWKNVLRSLGDPSVASVDEEGIHTKPMRTLDSYDDRFDGSSKTLPLSTEQRAAHEAFENASTEYKAAMRAASAAEGT